MPLYEYRCDACDRRFELLVRRFNDPAACPDCGNAEVEKQLSTFAMASASQAPTAGAGPPPQGGCCGGGCGCAH
ncbi:MAG: zinc ribbon domain-containing protein [Deltaproteobacteria bacterium]|nr:zinc ribbon domain-containing protein [Deltaproteobacteria bacterium]